MDDTLAVLVMFTMEGGERSFYRTLNAALRADDRWRLKPWFVVVHLLMVALYRLPSYCRTPHSGVNGA